MARDRKRAKQRQQRRSQQRAAVRPSQPRRENVPGELDHASGQVDQFEAALVAGADGEPVDDREPRADAELDEAALDAAARAESAAFDAAEAAFDDRAADEDFDEEQYADAEAAMGGAGAGGRRPTAVGQRGGPPTAERREGYRVINFLRASWAELQRVQWPDRRQVAQATAVVLGFVALAGAYLGVADALFSRLVDQII